MCACAHVFFSGIQCMHATCVCASAHAQYFQRLARLARLCPARFGSWFIFVVSGHETCHHLPTSHLYACTACPSCFISLFDYQNTVIFFFHWMPFPMCFMIIALSPTFWLRHDNAAEASTSIFKIGFRPLFHGVVKKWSDGGKKAKKAAVHIPLSDFAVKEV